MFDHEFVGLKIFPSLENRNRKINTNFKPKYLFCLLTKVLFIISTRISSMHIGPFLIAPIFANCLHLKINRIKFRYGVLLLFVAMKLNRFASFEPL
uniref:Uncharacterized protein n=1 Tax=Gossypium raimondii TaxID=29730 RepID=A0A0D2PX16_GOSRA|nr:hypothetical protein B456_001G101800 [Gossypium raimondii]